MLADLSRKLAPVFREVAAHPGEFDHVPSNGNVVLQAVEVIFPGGTDALTLEDANRAIQFLPSPRARLTLPPNHPGLYLIKVMRLLSAIGLSAIGGTWVDFLALNPVVLSDRNGNRSSTPSFHFGYWSHSSPVPYITSDTRRHSPAICRAVHRFLKAIAKYLAPPILMLLRFYAPHVYERQIRSESMINWCKRS
jgi:hypothetical protein